MRNIGGFIDGKRAPSRSDLSESGLGDRIENINPATNERIGWIEVSDSDQVEQAVSGAVDAQLEWAERSGPERSRVLRRTAEILLSRNEELAALEVEEVGKPISEARVVDVQSAADCLNYFASICETLQGEYIEHGQSFSYVRREPLGVCAGIGAWNYPIQIAAWKAAPALACGNSFVFKPSEMTPSSAVHLAEIFSEAGLPNGVFNVVQGDGAVGRLLVEHEQIAKVSLTGEVGTGKKVLASAAATLKKVTMELGGKSPLLVFDDCDIESAVNGALLANFYTQGEICSNGTRVFVHKDVYPQFVERLIERTKKLKVGDPMDPTTDIGALISKEHCERVAGFVDQAKKEGARVLYGQGILRGTSGGNFYSPTVLGDCADEMTCVRDEIFGPVLSLLTFQDEDEVLTRANATQFGLAAGVFSQNIQRSHRVAKRLHAGIVWINNYNITPVEVPFGGVKQSGLGRENGWAAVEDYTQRKTIYVETEPVPYPFNET